MAIEDGVPVSGIFPRIKSSDLMNVRAYVYPDLDALTHKTKSARKIVNCVLIMFSWMKCQLRLEFQVFRLRVFSKALFDYWENV